MNDGTEFVVKSATKYAGCQTHRDTGLVCYWDEGQEK
jgi:hypothetical protein